MVTCFASPYLHIPLFEFFFGPSPLLLLKKLTEKVCLVSFHIYLRYYQRGLCEARKVKTPISLLIHSHRPPLTLGVMWFSWDLLIHQSLNICSWLLIFLSNNFFGSSCVMLICSWVGRITSKHSYVFHLSWLAAPKI